MSGNRRWFDGRPQEGGRRSRGKAKRRSPEPAGPAPDGGDGPRPEWLAEQQPQKDDWTRSALDLDAGMPDWLASSGGRGRLDPGARIIATPGPTERPEWLADYQPMKRDWSPARDRFDAELVRLARKAEEKRRRRRAWLGRLAAGGEAAQVAVVDSSQATEMAEPDTPYLRRAADFTSAAVSAAGEMWKRRATERAQVAEARARLQAQRRAEAARAQAAEAATPTAPFLASPIVAAAAPPAAPPAPRPAPDAPAATPSLPFEIRPSGKESAVPPPPEMPARPRGTWSVRPPDTAEPPTQVLRPRQRPPAPPQPPAPLEPVAAAPAAPPVVPPPPPPPPAAPPGVPPLVPEAGPEPELPAASPPPAAPEPPAAPAESAPGVRPWPVRAGEASPKRRATPPPQPVPEPPEPVEAPAATPPPPPAELKTPLPVAQVDLDVQELRGRKKRGLFKPFSLLGGMRDEIKEIQSRRELEREEERRAILATIRDLPDEGYQQMVLDIFRRDGYLILKAEDNVKHLIDLECQRHGERVFVQFRHRGELLQSEERVREVHEAVVAAGADSGFVFSDGSFTWGADELARQTGIVLVDGNVLVDLMEEITMAEAEKQKTGLGKALRGFIKNDESA